MKKNRKSNQQYCLKHRKRKIDKFLLKKSSTTKHNPPSNVFYMEFHRNFLIEYRFIGIVYPKFTRRM